MYAVLISIKPYGLSVNQIQIESKADGRFYETGQSFQLVL